MATDEISLNKLKKLHPEVREHAITAYNEAVRLTPVGVHPMITQTLRTYEESDKLYAQGRTKPGPIVTNAKGGYSYHNFALALDFVLVVNGKTSWKIDKNWMIVVECFKRHGFKWGGDFKSIPDAPHFEMTFGLTTSQLRARKEQNLLIKGTDYILI